MTEYVVTWFYDAYVKGECSNHALDPYTGHAKTIGCVVDHGHYERRELSKEFITEVEALNFIKNAPDDGGVHGFFLGKKAMTPQDFARQRHGVGSGGFEN